jgi:hypothetical protein
MNLKHLAGRVRSFVNRPEPSPGQTGHWRTFKWDALQAGIDALRSPRPSPEGELGGEETRPLVVKDRVPRQTAPRPEPRVPEGDRSNRVRPPAEIPEATGRAVRWKLPVNVPDLATIYKEVGIEAPLHGYGVDKLAEMLSSPHLASAPREVRAMAALVALEAARVPVRDVIEDAVLRSRALAAFEADKELDLQVVKMRAERRAQVLRDQLETLRRQKNGEIEELKRATEAAEQSLAQLRGRKRREEERLHRVVTHFVEPRPAVAAPAPAPARPAPSAADTRPPTPAADTRPGPAAVPPVSTSTARPSPASPAPAAAPAGPSPTAGGQPSPPVPPPTSPKTGSA